MTTEQILTAIGLVGIGGILKSVADKIADVIKTKSDSKHSLKETRYKAILLLAYGYVNYEKENYSIVLQRPEIKTAERLYQEIVAEWTNMSLYASDAVILKMKIFLEKKDKNSYNELILTMRKDLYGIKTKLITSDFILKT